MRAELMVQYEKWEAAFFLTVEAACRVLHLALSLWLVRLPW